MRYAENAYSDRARRVVDRVRQRAQRLAPTVRGGEYLPNHVILSPTDQMQYIGALVRDGTPLAQPGDAALAGAARQAIGYQMAQAQQQAERKRSGGTPQLPGAPGGPAMPGAPTLPGGGG